MLDHEQTLAAYLARQGAPMVIATVVSKRVQRQDLKPACGSASKAGPRQVLAMPLTCKKI